MALDCGLINSDGYGHVDEHLVYFYVSRGRHRAKRKAVAHESIKVRAKPENRTGAKGAGIQ
jgi:hypothetical protein